MYCHQCNIHFPEGLRYCKWCGQTLTIVRRVTNELFTCPSCSAPVQPGWGFCKACGVRLGSAPREAGAIVCPRCGSLTDGEAASCVLCGAAISRSPADRVAVEATTAVISQCSACGEALDTGSLYCKACGARVQQQPVEPTSSLLCSTCKSYSPMGSKTCRVCGEPLPGLAEGAQERVGTLPDLAGHLDEYGSGRVQSDGQGSGRGDLTRQAETLAMPPPDSLSEEESYADHSLDHQADLPGASVETSVLPGVAGSRSEQQAPTSSIAGARITSPVDQDEPDQTEAAYEGSEAIAVPSAERISEIPLENNGETKSRGFYNQHGAESRVRPSDEFAHTASPTGDFVEAVRSRSLPSPTRVGPRESMPETRAPKKMSAALMTSLLVGVLIIVGAVYAAWWFAFGKQKPEPESAVSVAAETPATEAPAAVPEGMLLIQGGTFIIGREGADDLDSPEHTVKIEGFFIDRTEVTNAEYKRFVDETGRTSPDGWVGGRYPPGRDKWPVTGVTWQDAADYAAWAGKRLPTEIEWEAAARGPDGRLYPWGNEWRSGVANIETSGITDVGAYSKGASPSGALDMIGNVWEWTADVFSLYPGSSITLPPLEPGVSYRVIRGGAYDGSKIHTASYRGFLDASKPYPRTGFRCAKSLNGN